MPKLSGATMQSLANLLDRKGSHSIIDGLYLRYEVPPMPAETNKMRKAVHLARELNNGVALPQLIDYIGRPEAGLGRAFQRGSQESKDLYENYDADLHGTRTTEERQAATATLRAAAQHSGTSERPFKRPGTTAPSVSPVAPPSAKRHVFVVRGRDVAAYEALEALLLALDLKIVSWDAAARHAGGGTPHTLDIVRAGIELSDAVVVLMTPDDLGQVKGDYFNPGRDDPREAAPSGQARQNVVFEAGWAMALNQQRVVLVRVGDVRALSDIEGLNYVWLDDNISARRQFVGRLKACALDVDDSGETWRTAGAFPSHT